MAGGIDMRSPAATAGYIHVLLSVDDNGPKFLDAVLDEGPESLA